MRFWVAHKMVTYLFATLGLVALNLGPTLNRSTAIAIVLGVVASWFAEGEKIESQHYSKAWNIIVITAFGVQIFRIFSGHALLSAGIEYAGVLQIVKLMTRRTAADYQQIILLGFLHLVAATVLSSGLEYGVLFLGFVIVTPWMLALTHMRGELESNEGDARKVALASKRFTGRGFFVGTAILSVPLFFVTATFFFAFPRVGLGYLSGLKTRVQNQAGFGDDVQLGGFGTIRDDHAVSLRIRLAKDVATRPLSIPIRLRGTSFDRYERGHWTRSTRRSIPVRRSLDNYPLFPKKRPAAKPIIRSLWIRWTSRFCFYLKERFLCRFLRESRWAAKCFRESITARASTFVTATLLWGRLAIRHISTQRWRAMQRRFHVILCKGI